MVYDIFLSYPRAEQDRVDALKVSLEALGLSVWMDRREIGDGAPVTETIVQGLARSRVLLAWYAPAYALSRPCQWELTAAYLAAQQEGGKVGQRLLIVNPVEGTAHVGQAHLRDCQHLSGRDAVAVLAARVRDAVDRTLPPFAHIRALIAPPWPAGPRRSGSNRFVGRLRELWDIHNGLIAGDLAVISGKPAGNDLVRVHGMGGIGKSLLAEEYALRFGAAYPGGIFWLSASPPDSRTTPEQQYQGQMRDLALRLGMPIAGQEFAAIEGALRRHLEGQGSYLWLVDDLPAGAKADLLHRWRAPSAQGKTLITSRTGGLSGNGKPIALEQLDDEAAFDLLTSRRQPKTDAERAAAWEILRLLGNHALAVDVTGAAVQEMGFGPMRDLLQNPGQDALDLVVDMADELPNGHERAVATTLLHSIQRMPRKALTVLQIAALLAVEPIPRGFVAAVFGALKDAEEPDPVTSATAIKAATGEGLLERVDDDNIASHILVSRTIRFHHPASEEMRRVVVEVMNGVMQDAQDIREHYWLAPLLPHALTLVEGVEDVETANLLGWVAQFEHERGAYATASGLFKRQLSSRKNLLGEEHPDTLTSMNNLGITWWALGDNAGSRALQEHVLSLRRRVLGDEHPDTLTGMNNLATSLLAQGDNAGARVLQEQELSICRRVLGEEHPDTLKSIGNLAFTLWTQGDNAGAKALQEHVLSLHRRILGEEHPDTLKSMNNLASTLWSQGDYMGARMLEDEVLSVRRRVLGDEHPSTLTSMSNLALTLRALDDVTGSRALLEHVLTLRRRVLGDEHPDTLKSMNNLAISMWLLGERAAGMDLQLLAYAGTVRVLGVDHPNTRSAAETLQQMRDAEPS